jgi:nitronate monooxygenase
VVNAINRGSRELAQRLRGELRLPVFAGPMFIASTPELLIEQCKAGIIGSLPALNLRSTELLDQAISKIVEELGAYDRAHQNAPAAPYSINLVAHKSNDRLDADLDVLVRHKVPIVIVSLAAPTEIVTAIHSYGGLIFNDVVSNKHALRCAEAGTDGLVAVAAGAGGHTGNVSPFALMQEIRAWWEGPLALSGCIANGRSILAAEVLGADFAYIGSPFLATVEANTADGFKAMLVASTSADVVITNCFTGVPATFLRPSIEANGLDPKNLVRDPNTPINIKDGGSNAKAWRDIWSAGQGIGAVDRVEKAGDYIARLAADYVNARKAVNIWIGQD